jgi:putative nucleotidyltransferase with HDIG domain
MQDTIQLPISQLRVGLYIHLDLGWMAHPFPLSQFRISGDSQLETLRGLGLAQLRVDVEKSDPSALSALVAEGLLSEEQACAHPVVRAEAEAARAAAAAGAPTPPPLSAEALERLRRKAELDAERACASLAEKRYAEAGKALKQSFELALNQPPLAREHCEGQVHLFLDQLLGADEIAIRLLSESAGDRACMHAINVAVISLLLGKALGLTKEEMFDVGVGAMLHDVGKIELPDRVRWLDLATPGIPAHERNYYQEHVSRGVVIGRGMGVSPGAMLVIAQHHEMADGSGFPLKLTADRMTVAARIVALVNRYDKLCNPATLAQALTPHEALAHMYSQLKSKFDVAVFGAFIKMMGVYPPGSLVQLNDERFGLVVAVNAARPLKPRVLVHDVKTRREEAVPINLEHLPGLGIRRSLRAPQLPTGTLVYLSPRPRQSYFFEPARAAYPEAEGLAA